MSVKDLFTGEYIGLCTKCCKEAQLTVSGNPELQDTDEMDNYFDDLITGNEDYDD
jgi:hypothetical protein